VKIADILEAPRLRLSSLSLIFWLGSSTAAPCRDVRDRYRLYLNRREIRHKLLLLRQLTRRKFVSGPHGASRNLEEIFERLNREHFDGLLGRPLLGWSRRPRVACWAISTLPTTRSWSAESSTTSGSRC